MMVPQRVMAVLVKVHFHGPMIKTYFVNQYGEKEVRYTDTIGHPLPKISVDNAIESGWLVPFGDGLLPDDSQTWQLSDEVEEFFGGRLTTQARRA